MSIILSYTTIDQATIALIEFADAPYYEVRLYAGGDHRALALADSPAAAKRAYEKAIPAIRYEA